MKLVSVDETKGWQYTKDGERIMLELPQEKRLVSIDEIMQKVFDKAYPEGVIYLSVSKTPSPAELFGGSWQVLNAGRALWTTGYYDSEGADLPIEAGLPNLSGAIQEVILRRGYENYTGVFANSTKLGDYWDTNAGHSYQGNRWQVNFNAASDNNIYGNSTTVQPPAYKVYAWKRIHYSGGSSGGGASDPVK